ADGRQRLLFGNGIEPIPSPGAAASRTQLPGYNAHRHNSAEVEWLCAALLQPAHASLSHSKPDRGSFAPRRFVDRAWLNGSRRLTHRQTCLREISEFPKHTSCTGHRDPERELAEYLILPDQNGALPPESQPGFPGRRRFLDPA